MVLYDYVGIVCPFSQLSMCHVRMESGIFEVSGEPNSPVQFTAIPWSHLDTVVCVCVCTYKQFSTIKAVATEVNGKECLSLTG